MARFEMNAAGLGGNAAAGTVDAAEMFELGLMYAAGREVAMDEKTRALVDGLARTLAWYRERAAATRGSAPAPAASEPTPV